jgi:FkbH-like protein
MFSSRGALTKLAAEAHRQIAPTLRLLQEQFNCNVFVHNTGNIRRHNSTVASYFKNFVTAVARKRAAKEVNELLAVEVADLNAAASHPVVLIDEPALVATHGELALGRKFYDSEPQHPTNLALRFAEIYTGIASAVVQLLGRKVVVVDLDNTVWAGVIGEGSIVHDHRRQRVLQSLRQKGVLLAIASKNDAKNVHWTGGTLKENDFVASQINWDPKALNIKRIAEDLNIKLKDFVFIDDRPDEREMVRMSIPGIHCLDATDEFTWKMLDWWAETLPEQSDADRTQMYLERRQRQAHLDQPSEKEDPQELLSSLGLKLQIRPVIRKELVRATELINRTNQFNTCGSRVSERQMTTWSDSPDYHILVADAADRFGTMGIVSVMIIQQVEDALEIPVWVLSCRVFGFSIESVMLNQVRRIAQRSGISVVRGLFVETPNNQPCRDVYSTDGFTAIGGGWELTVSGLKPDPPWLSITTIEKPSASLGRR